MKLTKICALLFLATYCPLVGYESISGSLTIYREACLKASQDDEYFKIFRRTGNFCGIVELANQALGQVFYNHILSLPGNIPDIDAFSRLDEIGNPYRYMYKPNTYYSPTLLRYIAIGDHISRLFQLPDNSSIVEIGAGFGGQCYVLSKMLTFGKYYIYDLPETCALINKVLKLLEVKDYCCIDDLSLPLPVDSIDLVISNYAFSECDVALQMDYIDKVISKAQRGYVIYNHLSSGSGIRSLTVEEFINILKGYGLNPKVEREFISTHHSNQLITWDIHK